MPELEGFDFHALRHTYTTNLLSNEEQPKDVQELLGYFDVGNTDDSILIEQKQELTRVNHRNLVVGFLLSN